MTCAAAYRRRSYLGADCRGSAAILLLISILLILPFLLVLESQKGRQEWAAADGARKKDLSIIAVSAVRDSGYGAGRMCILFSCCLQGTAEAGAGGSQA